MSMHAARDVIDNAVFGIEGGCCPDGASTCRFGIRHGVKAPTNGAGPNIQTGNVGVTRRGGKSNKDFFPIGQSFLWEEKNTSQNCKIRTLAKIKVPSI